MELFVYGPGFELLSIDPESIALQILLHELGIIHTTTICWSKSEGPGGYIPSLRDGTEFIYGLFSIVDHLEKKGYKIFGKTNNDLKVLEQSLPNYLNSVLSDVLLYYRFLDEKNFLNSTRPALAKQLPFFKRYFLPGEMVQDARTRLAKYYNEANFEQENNLENKKLGILQLNLDRQHKECLTKMSKKLLKLAEDLFVELDSLLNNGTTYLLGDSLSFSDILAYSYFSHLIYPNQPNGAIGDLVTTKFPNLLKYVDMLNARWKSLNFSALEQYKQPALSLATLAAFTPANLLKQLSSWLKTPSLMLKRKEHQSESKEIIELRQSRAYSVIFAVVSFVAYGIWMANNGNSPDGEDDNVNYAPVIEPAQNEEIIEVEHDDFD